MKAAPFEYRRAASVAEVCEALEANDEAMIIAGGQTLVPLMAMRFARPALLIDINDIDVLNGITIAGNRLVIKAATRQAAALTSREVARAAPLLAKALPWVGHGQTRARGTVGGSIALGDPSAEIPLVAVALGATITLHAVRDDREVPAEAFFLGAMETARRAHECLTEISFPTWAGPGRIGTGFTEVAERHGDFAIVAAAAQLQLDDDGVCRRAAVAVGGAAPAPLRLAASEAALVGSRLDEEALRAAAGEVAARLDPPSDGHASAEYRRRAAPALVRRAIEDAAREARA